MKYLFKNTKIVSTFGPAITKGFNTEADRTNPALADSLSEVLATINELIYSGINCVRFNFSHGSTEEQLIRSKLIGMAQEKIIAAQTGNKYRFVRPIVFMADTKGPEIRVYKMEASEGVVYEIGDEINIYCIEKVVGNKDGFSVLDSTGRYNMANDCVVGNTILVEDGKLSLEILEVNKDKGLVKVRVKNRHILKANKRINLPGADYSMDFLSEKDISDIKFAVDNGFEYIALSFVNSKENIQDVKKLILSYSKEKAVTSNLRVISKIETLKSCENIDEIIDESDAIMIARGDLGLEIPYYQVPYWTKEIIKRCRLKNKPVIVATQMLDSLEKNVVPTRAEVSDVYRAAELGSDCTMLSGETAQGLFPVIAVKTMCEIVYESEGRFDNERALAQFKENSLLKFSPNTKKLCEDLMKMLATNDDIGAVLTMSGTVTEEFMEAVAAMRLEIPLFNFIKTEKLESACAIASFSCPIYRATRLELATALHRSINPVFTEGLFSSADLPAIFKEFHSFFVKGSFFNKKVVYLDGGTWRV
ncbi:pyruvate kinase [Candidatus Mycoplasma haematobovis]|uniref:Pyruvate kinase n=1 Tax=Candidatus Mycoplasma haematobovis TaxID=432608 RepID=A0A1A9QD17_9MOLU|nr:pyruvate kinase [Candidatus Mycoplasma haematobovis]OAL10353.1 pyruvate kinase [Candidatus Mycoplasma haematobovis]